MSQIFYRSAFKDFGARSKIIRPLKLDRPEFISVGSDVLINDYAWLITLCLEKSNPPHMVIGDGTTIGHFNHISCCHRVTIGQKVLTADRVHISDNTHSFADVNAAILDQPVDYSADVIIGSGSWLGEGVSVLGCSIGKHCVIGANAVVTRDVPDYSVAAGVPARVIRQYNPDSGFWLKTNMSSRTDG